eukprot:CAMPEP_0184688638 /NCGR_PEP_ID=MMETSP0312-20130426/30207_1 /TAXON_ID=31354 /ORGANISM="Compsopogon coeruleus, Strain SAG 36.94" /LENGTH=712 /DNA_ID=CAMNT_0027145895 /DNA_START=1428 /DNA_END=3566 /DNA_ORIENTATION=+
MRGDSQSKACSGAGKRSGGRARGQGVSQERMFRIELPVREWEGSIVKAVQSHQIVVLVAETGSGKTTQLPQIVYKHQRAIWGQEPRAGRTRRRIVITQPRRVAAISAARRVAEERGERVAEHDKPNIGYAVRFDDQSNELTCIRYVTDGVLVREAIADPTLNDYDCVILDEVHERSVNTDLLLGIVKRAVYLRQEHPVPLRGLVMSATAEAQKIVAFFQRLDRTMDTKIISACALSIPGRMFPVKLMYVEEPVQDYLDATVTTCLQLHADQAVEDGDILAFLTGQEEIENGVKMLRDRATRHCGEMKSKNLVVMPLYAALAPEQQEKALAPLKNHPNGLVRKVIFATNIAETSVTIPGVRFVVDSGMAKVRAVNQGTRADILQIRPISQAQANQRAGRAGREYPGICFRLYSELAFEELEPFPIPEILRCDLSTSLLQIMTMGIRNPVTFDFMDAPNQESLRDSMELLVALGCLDNDMNVTALGQWVASLPVSPMLGRSLWEARKLSCIDGMVDIAAIMSGESLFLFPEGRRREADSARKRFASMHGDHLTGLHAFRAYQQCSTNERSNFCQDHFLNPRSLQSALSVRTQLMELCSDSISRNRKRDVSNFSTHDHNEEEEEEVLRKCLVAGYFRNAARLIPDDSSAMLYKSLDGGLQLELHPSSVLRWRGRKPEFVLYDELVITSRTYARGVSEVEPGWLVQASAGYYVASS